MTLTSLPNELIEHIASYLDLASTRSLRLTTSTLTRATCHLFRDRFFHQHTVTWTKQSLDTLVEISLDSQYGSVLRHLIIDATPQHSMHFWRLRKSIDETSEICITPYGAVKSPVQRELETQHALAEQKIQETNTFFNETRYDQKMLKQIFANLCKNAGGRSSLTCLTFHYAGLPITLSDASPVYCRLSQCEMSRPFVSTLAALASSPDIHITSILLARDAPHGAISIGRLETLAPSLSSFDNAFSTLHHLALNLRDFRTREEGFALPASTATNTPRIPFIVRFLAKATYLRSLELSCFSWFEPDVFTEIARHCVFPHLQSLKLFMLTVASASALSAFLTPALRNQLDSLKLRHVVLLDPEVDWAEWLAWLASAGDEGIENDDDGGTRVTSRITHLCVADLFKRTNEVLCFQGKRALCFGEDWAWRLRRTLEEGVQPKEFRPFWAIRAFAYPFEGLAM